MIEYLTFNPSFTDLHLTQYGIEKCCPFHDFGPAIRDYYLLHFVLGGKGRFETRERSYALERGQAFLIFPGEVTYYLADGEHPWKYVWVGFHGTQAEAYLHEAGLTVESPILNRFDPELVEKQILQMHESKGMERGRDLRRTALLYSLFSHMAEANPEPSSVPGRKNRQDQYVQKVTDFIETNYANKISISQIADYVGLDRSYLCAVFKARMGASVQEHLIRYRINKACSLMSNRLLTIGDIARSVGYEDPLLFSKMFKKEKGLSPKQYRSSNTDASR
ncbi:AraC family transcriptional regulator [Paenibacillus sanfengchensis]|uniref:AraC family transcriptional regulator n=1 Tax=Paenibacillus sanfengchensis TaxID=3119819 RepID=UPI002FE212B0